MSNLSSILHVRELRLIHDQHHSVTEIQSLDLNPELNMLCIMLHCLPLLISHFLCNHLLHQRHLISRNAWNMWIGRQRERNQVGQNIFFFSMSRVRTNTFAFALGGCEHGLGGQSKYPGRNTKRPSGRKCFFRKGDKSVRRMHIQSHQPFNFSICFGHFISCIIFNLVFLVIWFPPQIRAKQH